MRHITLSIITLLALAACSGKPQDNAARDMMLNARQLLAQRKFQAAEDTILAMRQRYPNAIDVRREALLLLDSIRMEGALDSLTFAATPDEQDRLRMKAEYNKRRLTRDAEALKNETTDEKSHKE